MKRILNAGILSAFALAMLAITSCNKNISSNPASGSSTTSATASASSSAVIAVAAGVASSDSVYVMQQCSKGQHRDSISASALPDSITAYLNANYSGYTFNKAFAVKDTTGTVVNYVVIIFFNNKPVGLLFDANGSFVNVLEQREPGDMHGPGWHPGGRFCNRDSLHQDTVALTDLPTAITSYMSANYAGDTLLKASRDIDSGYIIISANNGLYATVFTSSGSFVKRVELPQPPGKPQPVAQSSLPAIALTYLTATYPDYVFEKAFSVTVKGVLKGYLVLIDANSTRYAVAFDANGNFISAMPVW
ncbi:MAG TPA: PepSY-like domain-containing protein [Chitinophagaceae bacterium]|nr:PepSY-like domain-containing protein [Chitinophagaceae bacterium]